MTEGDYGRSQPERTREHERLDALIGTWHTSGQMEATEAGPGGDVDATDTYEGLPGGFGLLHTVEARVAGEKVEGAEIIGWDPTRGAYVAHYIGNGRADRLRGTAGGGRRFPDVADGDRIESLHRNVRRRSECYRRQMGVQASGPELGSLDEDHADEDVMRPIRNDALW